MTLAPVFATFLFYRGATFLTDGIVLKNPDGTPTDITGWTGDFSAWRESDDPSIDDPLFVLSTGNGKLTVDGPAGSVSGQLPFDETALIAVDIDGEQWPCRLVMTNPNPTPDYVERTVQGFIVAQA